MLQLKVCLSNVFGIFYLFQHDTTLAALMHSLKVFNNISPPYTACLIMELHQKTDGEYFIRLLYKNSTTNLNNYMKEPHLLTIPGKTYVLTRFCFSHWNFIGVITF